VVLAGAQVDGEPRTLADGALCANNPAQLALLEAAELAACAAAAAVALVLSLGCGQPAAAASQAMTGGGGTSGGSWFGGMAATIASAQGDTPAGFSFKI
jgi:hypothetical protein